MGDFADAPGVEVFHIEELLEGEAGREPADGELGNYEGADVEAPEVVDV